MQIRRATDTPTITGDASTFTGQVRIDALFSAPEPATVIAGIVSFAPGARTVWHTHPLGQILLVTSGIGWIQADGGPREAVRAGDVVWAEPGERHWHGATDHHAMTHVAIQQAQDGTPVTWLEHVEDTDYRG